ncbi:MAG: glycosyltransferase family 4 protein [Clostridiales bacterium]|nr:glycosyltransferase family 4 protein [Clostridiales bacterium]
MRIAMFTDTYFPQLNGVATSVQMLSQYLKAEGHEVFVFTTTDPDAPKQEDGVFRLPSLPFLKDRRMGMFYHPGIARMVRRLDLDLIHTHTEFCLGVFGRYLARELALPMVHTMHTIYEDYTHYLTKRKRLESMAKTVARRITTEFCNSADRVIVPTEKVKDLLLSYGVRPPIAPVFTGIETDNFTPGRYSPEEISAARRSMGVGEEDKVVLYLGRMAEEKNIDELLFGMQPYLRERKHVKFLLIGDGADRPRLEGMARELGMTDSTIFAGARPWDEIGMYYQAADVFVNASQSEAQGLTYIEAMAAGVPVVAKADRCLEGVVDEGVNGFTFVDQDGLIRALDRILGDPMEPLRLRRGALRTAERFSAGAFADHVAGEYVALTSRPHRRSA